MAKFAAKGSILAAATVGAPTVFTTIPGVGDFDLPLGEKPDIDVTTHDSAANEYVLGLADYPSFDVNMVWDGTGTQHAALVAANIADTVINYKVTGKDTKTYTFAALVKGIKIAMPVKGAQTAVVSFRQTGAITIA